MTLPGYWSAFPLLFTLQLLISCSRADVFTAMVDLENLLLSEAASTSTVIDQYIESEEARLERLRNLAEDYEEALENPVQQFRRHHLLPGEEDESAVMNPISAFLFIKRMARDWKQITRLMHHNMADKFIKNIADGRLNNSVKYPDEEDLEGAALGLLRLQETYELVTSDLANGYVGGDGVGRGFSAEDCYEIGKAAYNQKDYFYTLEWMAEALQRQPTPSLEADILEYQAYALYQQGNQKRALVATRRLAQLDPDHPRAAGNVKWYEERMSPEQLEELEDELPELLNQKKPPVDDIPEREVFERLCRGDFRIPAANASKLYCYRKMDKPFLRLAPLKVEIVRYEPLVVLFRGVLSDPEIAVLKKLATPRLRRATVQNAKTGKLEFASYRISKSAWLKGEEHPHVARINKRIHDMTNLDLETAEELQIQNYGIGGHYDPHFDFSRRGEKDPYGNKGNRIATVLFYMSQPTKGGLTVYTELGMGVPPSVHDALFWYNLKRDGEGDMRTRHAGCPVLNGIKWASNKWIHERGQEWIRPCGLTREVEERFVGDTRPY